MAFGVGCGLQVTSCGLKMGNDELAYGLTRICEAGVVPRHRMRRDELLAGYTSMRVGGPADLLIICESVDEVIQTIALARQYEVPWRMLGGGCNVLVADDGIRGLVIINRACEVTFGNKIQADAGLKLAVLARKSVERELMGLEWATGLPGTVGGAVAGNAGACGGSIADVLHSATVLEPNGEVVERSSEWFEFEYRNSRVKRSAGKSKPVILRATFRAERGAPQALKVRAQEILEWRREHHPSEATMGSTFKNPPGDYAGRLIDEAGLKGHTIGGAKISEKHANFFINTGEATAADIWALIEHTRSEVKKRFDLELELEIEPVGKGEFYEA